MIRDRLVLAVIPARGGSKGVPGKNIAPVAGRPLIAWTIAAARQSKYIDRLVVSSDDDRIIEAARASGCEAPFKRSAELATDTSTTMDVIVDALDRLPGHGYVVVLQPTSPLRTGQDIDDCIEAMLAADAPAAVSLRPAIDHPWLVFRLAQGGALSPFATVEPGTSLRRQDLPEAVCLNGAVYVADCDWLRKHRSFLSDSTVGHVMPAERSADIDTPADLEQVRSILESAH